MQGSYRIARLLHRQTPRSMERHVQLTGVSAIVTGGSGGLGEATVRRLVTAGVATVIADLAEERSEALAQEV